MNFQESTTILNVTTKKSGNQSKAPRIYIYIYIYHYHHVALPAQISFTLCHYRSLSSIAPRRSSRLYSVSGQTCCIKVLVVRPAFAPPCEGVHRSISVINSPLLLLQFTACLVHIIWIVFGTSCRWSYMAAVCGVLLPGLVQYSSQPSWEIAVKLFLHMLYVLLASM